MLHHCYCWPHLSDCLDQNYTVVYSRALLYNIGDGKIIIASFSHLRAQLDMWPGAVFGSRSHDHWYHGTLGPGLFRIMSFYIIVNHKLWGLFYTNLSFESQLKWYFLVLFMIKGPSPCLTFTGTRVIIPAIPSLSGWSSKRLYYPLWSARWLCSGHWYQAQVWAPPNVTMCSHISLISPTRSGW